MLIGLASTAAFIGLVTMVDVSSSALEDDEVSSARLNNLLLLTLLSSEIGERSLWLLFFFSSAFSVTATF